MGEIKITIEESGEPIIGLEFADFNHLPDYWVDVIEVEPGVYLPVIKEE